MKLLEIKNLSVKYTKIQRGIKSSINAVDNISLSIQQGEVYALAGESGCGKSTIAKSIMKLVMPKSGEILFEGKSIHSFDEKEKKLYPQKVQMIFQNPYSSLNPKMKIKDTLEEPLIINTDFNRNKRNKIINEAVKEVGLSESCLNLYPHEFSGGQRQRVAIARALILNPALLVADEPVSALDASIQAQILNLLKDLKYKRKLTILFISHDMNVINYLADRVGIMNNGKLIEENYTETVMRYPKENYTKSLISAIPTLCK